MLVSYLYIHYGYSLSIPVSHLIDAAFPQLDPFLYYAARPVPLLLPLPLVFPVFLPLLLPRP